jgi:hypothetical protein
MCLNVCFLFQVSVHNWPSVYLFGKFQFSSRMTCKRIVFTILVFSVKCWILSWAVTLEISAPRRSDKPVKNL